MKKRKQEIPSFDSMILFWKRKRRIIKIGSLLRHPFSSEKRKLLRAVLWEKWALSPHRFFPKTKPDVHQIPVFLVCFEQLSYLKRMISWLERHHLTNIHIIDNHSTYGPLLEYLDDLPYKVHHMEKNYGHRVLWESGKFDDVIGESCYIVSDPDIAPHDDLPENFLEELYRILGAWPCVFKVGFALRIDDLPETPGNRLVREWEAQWWKKRKNDRLEIYLADIDTTFALYRPGTFPKEETPLFYSAIRVAGNFTARHLPWYRENGNGTKGAETEEEKVYRENADPRFASWTRDPGRYEEMLVR